jgi:hypothetical protein
MVGRPLTPEVLGVDLLHLRGRKVSCGNASASKKSGDAGARLALLVVRIG